jgi:alkylation response protein AidB-like acyl-CoA dehydrogenase
MDVLIELTAEYTRERKAFGQSILDNQVVHFRLAELQTEVEALRSLLYRTIGELSPLYNSTPLSLSTDRGRGATITALQDHR